MKLSGDRWCEVHIASGEGEAEAPGMAERTLAAYTGALAEPSGDPGQLAFSHRERSRTTVCLTSEA